MKIKTNRRGGSIRFLASFAALVLSTFAAAAGISLSSLYSFTNAADPLAAMVPGTNGYFYGTTMAGGTNGKGSVFMLTPAGVYTDLVSFNGTNGSAPASPLLLDADGNFYGTASAGGPHNAGVIFRMNHAGGITNIGGFAQSNGATPLGALIRGKDGALYGTASAGGSNGLGDIFSWSTRFGISNRYSFSSGDGANPQGGLVFGTNGAFYGTTLKGGTDNFGTVFQFVPTNNTLTTLDSFSMTNGMFPSGLAASSNGILYGTTIYGGSNNLGTVYQVTSRGTLTTLVSFALTNGSNPESPVAVGNDGFVYGTTFQGGVNGKGLAFRVSTNLGGVTTTTGGGGRGGRGGFGGAPSTNSVVISNLVSFAGGNGANPMGGLVLAGDGNYYGTTTEGGANGFGNIFKILGFPPSIFQQPTNVNLALNGTAHFSVGAAGTQPLAFQWTFDGAPLATSASVTNVTNSVLTITGETLAEAGSYAVIVTNLYGAVTSSVAVLAIPAPTIAIKTVPAHVPDGAYLFTGTASDKYGVSSVQWQINNGPWNVAGTSDGWTNWNALATLQAGSNVFRAYSVDPVGNPSATNSVNLFYLTHSTLTLVINGSGTISRKSVVPFGQAFTGSNLIVGSNYTITAVPRLNNYFSNWTGSITATNNPLTFLMTSNMVIVANFVTNPFVRGVGTYTGLFYDTNSAAPESTGLFGGLSVRQTGAYTAGIFVGGTRYSAAGAFDLFGNATNQIKRSTNLGPLSLSMHLDWDVKPPIISGTVQGSDAGGWTAQLTNLLDGTGLGSAEYTLLIPPGADAPTNSPAGTGYALIANHLGILSLSGVVADAAPFGENVAVTETLQIPFYASLYTNRGVLFGWLDLSGGTPTGSLTWLKDPKSGRLFTNGFTNTITVQSSPWTNRGAKTPAISLPGGAQLDVAGGMLPAPLDFAVALSSANVLVKEGALPTNTVTGSIAPKTGLLTVTFGNGNHKATTAATGAILQNQNSGAGFFITTTNAGSITLTPNP